MPINILPFKTALRFEKAVRYLEPPNTETWAVHSVSVIKKSGKLRALHYFVSESGLENVWQSIVQEVPSIAACTFQSFTYVTLNLKLMTIHAPIYLAWFQDQSFVISRAGLRKAVFWEDFNASDEGRAARPTLKF